MATNSNNSAALKATCDTFSKDRATIAGDLTRTIANFEGINYGSSNDLVITNLNNNLNQEYDKYKNIENIVNDVLTKTEEIMQSLTKAYEDMEKLNALHQDLMASKPTFSGPHYINVVINIGEDKNANQTESVINPDYVAYEQALQLWEQQKAELESKINELQQNIDTYEGQLEALNTNGIQSLESLNKANSIAITPYVTLTDSDLRSLNYREALYDECNNLLKSKNTDLEKLGEMLNYTHEEIMEELVNKTYKWYAMCDKIPGNIEKIMNFNEKEVLMTNYSIAIQKDFKLDEYDFYSSTVNIGGVDFEVIQSFDKYDRSFLNDLNRYTLKGDVINRIAGYPSKMFDTITSKSAKILLLDEPDKFHDVKLDSGYGEALNFVGLFCPNPNSKNYTITVDQGGTNDVIQTLDHELSHCFDYLNGENKYSSLNHYTEYMKIFGGEYSLIANLNGHGQIYDSKSSRYKVQSVSNETKLLELFAETGSLYLEYGKEVSQLAPDINNLYGKLYGEYPDKARTIQDVGKGEALLTSKDFDKTLKRKPIFTFSTRKPQNNENTNGTVVVNENEVLKDTETNQNKRKFTFDTRKPQNNENTNGTVVVNEDENPKDTETETSKKDFTFGTHESDNKDTKETDKKEFTFGTHKSENNENTGNTTTVNVDEKLKEPDKDIDKVDDKKETDKKEFIFGEHKKDETKINNQPETIEEEITEIKKIKIKHKVYDKDGGSRYVTQVIEVPVKKKVTNNKVQDYTFDKYNPENHQDTATINQNDTNIKAKENTKVITEYDSERGILYVYYPDGHVMKIKIRQHDYMRNSWGGRR